MNFLGFGGRGVAFVQMQISVQFYEKAALMGTDVVFSNACGGTNAVGISRKTEIWAFKINGSIYKKQNFREMK